METIQSCISFQASAAAKVIARLARAELAPLGVTPIQFAVLQFILEANRATAADIGAALMIDSATIVGVIDRLETMDFVSRVADRQDRRIKRLVLTAPGAAALPAMQAAMDRLNAEIDRDLGHLATFIRDSLRTLASLSSD